MALTAWREGKQREAALLCADALNADPHQVDALLLMARLHDEQGERAQAADLLAGVLEIRPDCYEALVHRAALLQALLKPQEALECSQRALAIRPESAEALHLHGTALHALERDTEALACFDRALAIRPTFAEALNSRGDALRGLERHRDALACYRQALAIRPDYMQALYNRGVALDALKQHVEAVAAYGQVVAGPADSADAHLMRGNALRALDRLEEALASYERALEIQPHHAEALNNRGNVLRDLGRVEEALESYARVLSFRTEDAEAHWNASLALLTIGDYARGWAEYEWRWQTPGLKLPRHHVDKPLWLGQDDLEGKTVIVHPEQGFGDSIQMVRYVPPLAARGARVVLACHAWLAPLLATVAGVSAVVNPGEDPPAFDYHVPIMSLPHAFRTTLGDVPSQVPYLRAPEAAAQAWRRRLAPYGAHRKVGLVWAGNPKHTRDRSRSLAPELLARLLDLPDCAFFSLQKGDRAGELSRLDPGGERVVDYSHELETFGDTAGLIDALDLVISVDTAVAHLAGALAKPVWILLPFTPDWRWMLGREDSPWYPTARLFRQRTPGDWESVVAAITSSLGGTSDPA